MFSIHLQGSMELLSTKSKLVTVHFLNVMVSNATGVNITELCTKPTAAHRYLHTKSFHPKHTFSGIPFSQMHRAVIICSTTYLCDLAIRNIISYFLDSGYKCEALEEAKSTFICVIFCREALQC